MDDPAVIVRVGGITLAEIGAGEGTGLVGEVAAGVRAALSGAALEHPARDMFCMRRAADAAWP